MSDFLDSLTPDLAALRQAGQRPTPWLFEQLEPPPSFGADVLAGLHPASMRPFTGHLTPGVNWSLLDFAVPEPRGVTALGFDPSAVPGAGFGTWDQLGVPRNAGGWTADPMLPVREVFLASQVVWDPTDYRVRIAGPGPLRAELTVGRREATVNGQTVLLDPAPRLEDGRVLVPRDTLERFRAAQPGGAFVVTHGTEGEPRASWAPFEDAPPAVEFGVSGRPQFVWDLSSVLSYPGDVGRFLLGEGRAAVGLINPVDWARGLYAVGTTFAQHGIIEGGRMLGSAFLDSLWPFDETDMYQAGQEFMNLTLALTPFFATVPATKLPVVGPRLDTALQAIQPTWTNMGRNSLGQRIIGATHPLTGEIFMDPILNQPRFASQRRATLPHERYHAWQIRALPRWLRGPRHWAYEQSPTFRYLEECAAESYASGWRAGVVYPIGGRYVAPAGLVVELTELGGLSSAGILGRQQDRLPWQDEAPNDTGTAWDPAF